MGQPVISDLIKIHIKSGDYAASTIDSKQRAAMYFIKAFGDVPVDSVTYGHGEDYQCVLLRGDKKRRSPKTVNLHTVHMHTFFNWAVKRRYIDQNPFFGLRLLKAEDKKMPVFSDDEIVRIYNCADLRWRVLVTLGLLGLREGEALNLVRDDLYFDKGYILIRPKKDSPTTWAWRIKNRKAAYAPLPECLVLPDIVIPVHKIVAKLISTLPANQPYVCVRPNYYPMLLERKRQGNLYFRKALCPWGNFNRDFRALLKRAAIKSKSFHDLRRTFAGNLIEKGYSLKELQTLLRHASIDTTAKFYVNIEEQELVARVNETLEHYVSLVP